MRSAFFLWLIAALTLAVAAVSRWGQLGLGLLFILLATVPPVVYAWHRGLLSRRKAAPPPNQREAP